MVDVTRRAAIGGLAALVTSTSSIAAPRVGGRGRKPNILFIVTDQEFGPANYPKGLLEKLPMHQWLMERGLTVWNYHVQTTPCSPSRSTILTGQHTQKTGIFANSDTPPRPELNRGMATLGTMLRAAGYYSSYKGKWHLSGLNRKRNWNQVPGTFYPNTRDYLEEYGFSDYGFYGEYIGLTWEGFATDRLIAGDAAKLILDRRVEQQAQGRPWFLAVNLINPHDIMFYDATGEQSKTRRAEDLLAPVKPQPGDPLYDEDLGFDLPESFYKDDLSTKPEAHRAIVGLNNSFYGKMERSDLASWRRYTNYYYNCLRDLDRNLASLRWALERSGQLDDTIIVYTTDHGERAGGHGLRQKAGTIYREETNCPMIIVHPDVAGARDTRALMSAIDIAPTLLGLAGADASWRAERFPDLKGVDVSRLLEDPNSTTERDKRGHLFDYAVRHMWAPLPPQPGDGPDDLRFDLSKRRLHRGVHDGRYKFARYFAPAQHHIPTDWATLSRLNDLELYDTHRDPNELVNLARHLTHRDTVMRLNRMTNALIKLEIGTDDGREYPGPAELYNQA